MREREGGRGGGGEGGREGGEEVGRGGGEVGRRGSGEEGRWGSGEKEKWGGGAGDEGKWGGREVRVRVEEEGSGEEDKRSPHYTEVQWRGGEGGVERGKVGGEERWCSEQMGRSCTFACVWTKRFVCGGDRLQCGMREWW